MDSELGLMRFSFFPSNLSESSIFSDHLKRWPLSAAGLAPCCSWPARRAFLCLVGHGGLSLSFHSAGHGPSGVSLAYTSSHCFGNLSRKMVQSPHVEASTFQRDDLNDRSDLWKRLEYPSLPSGEVWMPLAVHRALRVLASAHLSSLLQIHVIPVILLQHRIRLVLIHPPAISPLDCVFSASLPSPFTFCLPPILKTDSPPQTP